MKRQFKFLCLFLFSLFLGACSSFDAQFSYFDMLDTEKRTVQNKRAAEKFWSTVRPVSTLSASHYKLGRYYQQQGKHAKAIEEFSKALRNDNRYCKAHNGIAMSYDALRRCKTAYDSYELGIQCDQQEAYMYNNYAISCLLCGDYEKGLALLLEALQFSGDNNRIKNNVILARRIIDRKKATSQFVLQGEAVPSVVQTHLAQAAGEDEQAPPNQLCETHNALSIWERQAAVMGEDVSADTVENDPVLINSLAAMLPVIDPAAAIFHRSNGAVEVSNGNGVTGMARKSAAYLRGHDFTVRRITNAKHFRFTDSVIFYREGYLQMAKKLAMVIPGFQEMEKVESLGRASIGVRVLLGKDLVSMQFPGGYVQNVKEYTGSENEYIISSIRIRRLR